MPPIMRDKTIRMHVYIPLSVGGKFVRSIHKTFAYCHIKVGDVFTMEKRPADYHKMIAQKEVKVKAVRYNWAESACIVILEGKDFEHMDLLNRFVSGRS